MYECMYVCMYVCHGMYVCLYVCIFTVDARHAAVSNSAITAGMRFYYSS
jgi:hypothetical protein